MCLAIPGKILEIMPGEDDMFRMARVSFDGVTRNVNLAMVPEAKVDDFVLVHVGVAIQTIDEEEAQKNLALLKELDEFNELNAEDELS